MKIRVKNIFQPQKTPILAIFDPKRSFLRRNGWSKNFFRNRIYMKKYPSNTYQNENKPQNKVLRIFSHPWPQDVTWISNLVLLYCI